MNQINTNQTSDHQLHRMKWIRYLSQSASEEMLSDADKHRLSLADYFYDLQVNSNYSLYHFTLTYKPPVDFNHTINHVQSFYINFHTRYFLPLILGTKNFQSPKFKSIQPRVLSFLDEHHHDKFTSSHEPSRLHHHAIIALNPVHQHIIDHYTGDNQFSIISSQSSPYLTCNLVSCDVFRVLYASKMYWKYPDFLSFPDKTYRTRQRYKMSEHTRLSYRKIEKRYFELNKSTHMRMQRLKNLISHH